MEVKDLLVHLAFIDAHYKLSYVFLDIRCCNTENGLVQVYQIVALLKIRPRGNVLKL
jgi:hypothetical protein